MSTAKHIVDALLETEPDAFLTKFLHQNYIDTWARKTGLYRTWEWSKEIIPQAGGNFKTELVLEISLNHSEHTMHPMEIKLKLFVNDRLQTVGREHFGTGQFGADTDLLAGKLYDAVKEIEATDWTGRADLHKLEQEIWAVIARHVHHGK